MYVCMEGRRSFRAESWIHGQDTPGRDCFLRPIRKAVLPLGTPRLPFVHGNRKLSYGNDRLVFDKLDCCVAEQAQK